MNKKVLTLCAGFLLAGGLFSTVDASLADMVPGQYYRIALAANSGSHSASQYYLDSDSHPSTPWYVEAADLDNDGSSWWTVEQVKDPVTDTPIAYRLVNKKGVYYTVKDASEKEYKEFIQDPSNRVNLNPSGVYWSLLTYDGNLTSSEGAINSTTYWGVDNEKIIPQALSVGELNTILETSFGLQICYQPLKSDNSDIDPNKAPVEYADLQGNPFTGTLVAANGGTNDVSVGVRNAVAIYQGTTNKLGKRVVLTKATWGSQGGGTTQVGYKFATYTDSEYAANKTNNNIIADRFVVTQPAVVAGAPLEVSTTINGDKYELVVTIIENEAGTGNVYRLTMAPSYDANSEAVADYTFGGEAATQTNTVQNTYVQFGITNLVNYSDFYGKLWNIYKDSKVATPSCSVREYYGNDGNPYSWIPVAQVAANYPEGQWLFDATKDLDNDGVQEGAFVNRESGHVLSIPNLRYVEGKENIYTKGDATYTITPAGDPSDNYNDGYLAGYTTDQLKQKAFFIGTPIAATKDTVWLSKAANGKLEFVEDKADAVEFRLTMADFDQIVFNADSYLTAKNFTSYTVWKDKNAGTTEQKTDVVNFHKYFVTEAVTGDRLNYDSENERFALTDEFSIFNPIVIKKKGNEVYNLLYNVVTDFIDTNNDNENDTYATNQNTTKSFCSAEKLYGAQNVAELVKSDGAYGFTENDIFVVVDADAQQYRGDFSNTGVLDTIKVFRNSDNSYVLYEKGDLLNVGDQHEGFLGMENINDPEYADMHAAMLADTAFYSNTYRPQYMLAVDADIVNDGWTCPLNPEHNTQAWRDEHGGHCADAVQDRPYIQGRYLVNLVDSALAATANGVKFADNKFVHEYYDTQATPYYRLGFVQAKHIGDSLIIASTNDTINLKNNPEDQVCTFAFKYVDANRDAFTIETLYRAYDYDEDGDIDHKDRGYIKYQNGVPVVTPKASEAWVFDLEETSEIPTANETIENAAEATVSVVATDGAVIVKGAEGKNVVVSTILGKVVANEVLNSDNETIAAPAGIVVVSVDGESFKVAVK